MRRNRMALEIPPPTMRLRGVVIHAEVPERCGCGGEFHATTTRMDDVPLPHDVYRCAVCSTLTLVKPRPEV